MRKIILMMMLTTIAGCGEKASVSKTETDAHPAQNTNMSGQFGSGVQSPEEKFAEVKQKAESGSSKDQLGLGRMYYNGVGVTKDDAKAAEWWQKAAAQGNEAAQEALKNLRANSP
ncbi:MAG: SEL1-like repeat protein [Nitrosomonadales bacterium]|nr:SEL1-like repeat protein [Nitrosomonadales bacterium]